MEDPKEELKMVIVKYKSPKGTDREMEVAEILLDEFKSQLRLNKCEFLGIEQGEEND